MTNNIEVLRGLVAELRESITDYGDHGENMRNEVLADLLNQTGRIDAAIAALSAQAEAQAGGEVLCVECEQPTMHMGSVCYSCSHPAAPEPLHPSGKPYVSKSEMKRVEVLRKSDDYTFTDPRLSNGEQPISEPKAE